MSNEPADSFARRVEAHLALLDKLGTPAPRWGYLLANAFVDPSWVDAMDAQAGAIARIVEQWVPETWQAFRDYRLEGHSMSRMEVEAIRRLMSGRPTTAEDVGMSAREWRDFRAMFGGGQ